METLIASYKGTPILFVPVETNGLLLKTTDICNVLGINERPVDSALSKPSMNLTTAVTLAKRIDADFAMWLNETFAGYDLETHDEPFKSDDDWISG